MIYAATVTTSLDHATDEQLDALVDALAPHSGVPSMWCGRLSVTLSVDAPDLAAAAREAADIVLGATCALLDFGDEVTAAAVEVLTEQEQARRLDLDPPTPDLIPTAAAADLLGVSRQRVLQLRDEHPTFPPPIRLGGRGLHWSRSALLRFEAVWRHGAAPAEPLDDDEQLVEPAQAAAS